MTKYNNKFKQKLSKEQQMALKQMIQMENSFEVVNKTTGKKMFADVGIVDGCKPTDKKQVILELIYKKEEVDEYNPIETIEAGSAMCKDVASIVADYADNMDSIIDEADVKKSMPMPCLPDSYYNDTTLIVISGRFTWNRLLNKDYKKKLNVLTLSWTNYRRTYDYNSYDAVLVDCEVYGEWYEQYGNDRFNRAVYDSDKPCKRIKANYTWCLKGSVIPQSEYKMIDDENSVTVHCNSKRSKIYNVEVNNVATTRFDVFEKNIRTLYKNKKIKPLFVVDLGKGKHVNLIKKMYGIKPIVSGTSEPKKLKRAMCVTLDVMLNCDINTTDVTNVIIVDYTPKVKGIKSSKVIIDKCLQNGNIDNAHLKLTVFSSHPVSGCVKKQFK